MSAIKRTEFKQFDWINISQPDEEIAIFLSENFKFHHLNIQECLLTTTRSKVDIYQNYSYFVLLFPVYHRNSREIRPIKIDFFISRKYIITLAHGNLMVFSELFNVLHENSDSRENFKQGSPERLLYEILNRLFLYSYPMIDHVIVDCDNIQKEIFSRNEKKMVSEIHIIRRNVTDFRKIMQGHKNVLKKILFFFKESTLFAMKKSDVYFDNLIDQSKEIWDTLTNLKERIEALQETNESQISFKLSDTMRMLTIISVFTFPLTLTAAIFAISLPGMPLRENPYGFWIVIGIMFTIFLSMLAYFQKKKWL